MQNSMPHLHKDAPCGADADDPCPKAGASGSSLTATNPIAPALHWLLALDHSNYNSASIQFAPSSQPRSNATNGNALLLFITLC